jgi:hypothetical protein
MLTEVLGVLKAEGWIESDLEYQKTIYLSHGTAQSMLLSRRSRPEFFVKFSTLSSLSNEAERCEAAAKRFPGIVPGFIGYFRHQSIDVLVTRAVNCRSMDASMIQSWRHAAGIYRGLEDFFGRMQSSARPISTRRDWAEAYRDYFRDHQLAAQAEASLDRMLTALEGLPAFDQHGDFVANNLGLGPDDRLTIFDWEDYGAVDAPGLDLFTLEFSLRGTLGSSARPAAGASMSQPRPVLELKRLCGAMHLPLSVFEDLRLSYAFVFRFLKRNYGQQIQDRVDSLIAELIAASPATARPPEPERG